MQSLKEAQENSRREYAQLLRLHQRVLAQLETVAGELESPGARAVVRGARRLPGDPEGALTDVLSAVEEAIRTLKVSTSELRVALIADQGPLKIEGVSNLPPTLARFLAERQQLPEFSFEVGQDEVRGWVIRWKELTAEGRVRGGGQFYERPYAWLDDG